LNDITDRDNEHALYVCSLAAGHRSAHEDFVHLATWTDGEHWGGPERDAPLDEPLQNETVEDQPPTRNQAAVCGDRASHARRKESGAIEPRAATARARRFAMADDFEVVRKFIVNVGSASPHMPLNYAETLAALSQIEARLGGDK
jgi:hypothetical protein